MSKYEGGLWTLKYVPERYKYIIDNAIREWYFGEKGLAYKKEDLDELKQFLIDKIQG